MLEKLFKLRENDTTVKTEVIAGLTTFILIMYRFRLEISGVIHQSIPKRSVEGTGICRGGAV